MASVTEFDLRSACREGNVELVKKCLSSGVNPNATAYGIAALHFAAKEGQTEIIQLLIDAGAKVNALDGIFWSSLDHAIEYRKYEAIKVLLKNGANQMIMRHDIPKQCNDAIPPGWKKVTTQSLELQQAREEKEKAEQEIFLKRAEEMLREKENQQSKAQESQEGQTQQETQPETQQESQESH
eukprot:TRINITY_DN2616_c0_g1_i2.p1 TRINITY_DN2616_c0_g1~~TRINITY_DN2616_c0_g1_i2.p1  ORF type:complete len:183 (-),score=47.50 TRINITY_DN2616_c0_g1_i2:59-607(-)